MDDKKYFCFDGDNMPGRARYYKNDKEKCSVDIRFIGKNKYPKKILMWPPILQMFLKLGQLRTCGVFDWNFLQNLMGSVKTKLRAITNSEALATNKK